MVGYLIYLGRYLRERFTFWPWGILPIYTYLIGKRSQSSIEFALLLNLYLGFLLFRAMDDYGCWQEDQTNNKSMAYLRPEDKPVLKFWVFAFMIAYTLSSLLLLTPMMVGFMIAVLMVSLLGYRILKHPFPSYVALLKYPLFIFIVSQTTNDIFWPWGVIGSLLFIARGFFNDILIFRNQRIEISIFGILLFLKYFIGAQ